MAAPRGAPARRAAPPRALPAAALLLAALLGAARPVTAKKTTAAYGTPPNRPGKDVFATAANLTKVMLDDPLALCNDNSQGVSRAVPLGPTACAAWCKQLGGARPICAHAARGRDCDRCGAARMGAGSRLRAGCGPGRALAWPDVYRALALRCRWLLLCPCVGPALPEQLAGVFGGGAVVRGARRTRSSRHRAPPLGASPACTARGLTPPARAGATTRRRATRAWPRRRGRCPPTGAPRPHGSAQSRDPPTLFAALCQPRPRGTAERPPARRWPENIFLEGIFDTDTKRSPWAHAHKARERALFGAAAMTHACARSDGCPPLVSQVYVGYCSSDAYVGNSGFNANVVGWSFRGARIVTAVIERLIADYALGNTTEPTKMLLGGCSAGARGAMYNLDYGAFALWISRHACALLTARSIHSATRQFPRFCRPALSFAASSTLRCGQTLSRTRRMCCL